MSWKQNWFTCACNWYFLFVVTWPNISTCPSSNYLANIFLTSTGASWKGRSKNIGEDHEWTSLLEALNLCFTSLSWCEIAYCFSDSLELGVNPVIRRYLDKWQDIIIIPNHSVQIGYHGYLVQWKLYSERRTGRKKEKVYTDVIEPIQNEFQILK